MRLCVPVCASVYARVRVYVYVCVCRLLSQPVLPPATAELLDSIRVGKFHRKANIFCECSKLEICL